MSVATWSRGPATDGANCSTASAWLRHRRFAPSPRGATWSSRRKTDLLPLGLSLLGLSWGEGGRYDEASNSTTHLARLERGPLRSLRHPPEASVSSRRSPLVQSVKSSRLRGSSDALNRGPVMDVVGPSAGRSKPCQRSLRCRLGRQIPRGLVSIPCRSTNMGHVPR